MPKVLTDPKTSILAAARAELSEKGGNGLNIRCVAKRAGVSIGTVYNYYPDKMHLLVALFLEEWTIVYSGLEKEIEAGVALDKFLNDVRQAITDFENDHKDVFFSMNGEPNRMKEGHKIFRSAIAALIQKEVAVLGISPSGDSINASAEIVIRAAIEEGLNADTMLNLAQQALTGGNK